MPAMSVSGVVSGMDWDSMIDEIITNAAKPAQVKVNKKTNLTNKKSLFEEMKVTMNSLQSSLSPLKLPSTYKAKTIDIERIDTSGSYKGVLTATVNADAEVNVWDVKVNKLATAQINRSKQITSSSLASTLNGLSSSTFYVNMGGQKIAIDVNATDSLEAVKSRINNTLKTLDNPLAITASVVDNKLILKSDNTGLGTRTASETIRYSSSGVNKLSNMSVTSSDAKNLKITSGSKSYTYGTDFTVANGNEIRWKQYDRSTEVALNDTVSVKYRMSADDVYESKGTYGTSEAAISGFKWVDNGTLASRLKIKDEDGNTYTYGKDFTLDDAGKVVWIEAEESTTNEPDTYTVSYSKTTTETASASGTKSGTQAAPTSYTVSYSKQLLSPVAITLGTNSFQTISSLPYSAVSTLDGLTATDRSSSTTASYIRPDDESEFTLTDGTTDYVYGKDYIIRGAPTGSSVTNSILAWYDNIYTTTNTRYVYDYAGGAVLNENPRPTSGTLMLSYTHAYKSQNGISPEVLSEAGTDYDNITITDTDGNEYTYGTDFTITDGEIEWLIKAGSDADDDITPDNFANLQDKYNAYIGNASDAALPTVTLLDSDGIVRTYFDPADRTLFTMTATDAETGITVNYEYGRDYVIRVNDSGDGYVFSWAVTGDMNKDGTTDIKDANTAVTTYTAAKGISTSGWKSAPSADSSYSFDFTYTGTTADSGSVSKTSTDKSLATVLKNVTVSSSEYASALKITDSSGTAYSYGTDWVIDSSGNITWLDQSGGTPTAYTATYKFSDNASASWTGFTIDSNGVAENSLTGLSIGDTGASTIDYSGYVYVDEAEGKAAFTMKDSDGNEYEYGVDYAIRYTDSTVGRFTVVTPNNTDWPDTFTNQTGTTSMPTSGLTLTYNNSVSSIVLSSVNVEDALGFIPSDYDKLTISSTSGTAYTEGTDYTIDTDTSEITWLMTSPTPTRPTGKYSLIYEAFKLEATDTYDSTLSQPQEVSLKNPFDSSSDAVSYEQVLKIVGISPTGSEPQSKIDNSLSSFFTLTDGSTTYKYGTDYRIIQGADTDADTGEHTTAIEWISGGQTPTANFTLTMGANEVLTTDGVKRSASDTIDPDSSNVQKMLYFDFNSASDITISDGTNTYSLGTDFTISQSNDGFLNPVISWNSDSDWFTQDTTSATNFTVSVTASNGTTSTYTGTRAAGSDELSLNLGNPIYPSASDFKSGTTNITQGGKTFYENEDFIIQDDENGHAQVYWLNDRSGGSEWYYPNPGTSYTINHTDSSGNTTSYTSSRSASTALSMADYGMTTANGSLTVQYGSDLPYKLDAEPNYDDDGNPIANTDGHTAIKTAYSIDIMDSGNGNYSFNWVTPSLTSRSGLPATGAELTVEYEYDANTFEITGEAADLLGLNDDVTAAQDAELVVDGETVYRASNDIGADYDNELLKGVTMHLKGTGEVSLDISHDAEKAVESIQTFVDTYNDLMSWMNTRMTEKQLDEDTRATVDSDDFRMRWGLLHGNALLRNTKSQMRSLTSQNFTFSFTQRKSSSEVYGTMGYNGLRTSSTLRLRIGTKFVDVTIDPTDTLQTIVAKINNDTKGGPMNDIYYDESGNKLQSPLLRASVENDKLVINSTSSDEITMSGSAAMNALKMNYTYKGLYQIGLETTSEDYGKSGELVFDADEFMTALEDNPDEVQELMLKFVAQFDTWTRSMLNSSATGETSGTLTREIENIQTQIDSINEYLENYQDRLDRMEENLRTKYGNTEVSLSKLTQQASSIAAILNQLNGTGSGGGYGQASS